VEDDMTLPIEKKDKMLREFYTYLETLGWTFTESTLPFFEEMGFNGRR
jgi:hypothetical protein